MWAHYNYTEFPIVKVNLVGKPENDKDFDNFLKNWLDLQQKKENFTLIFDTSDIGWVNPKYVFKMTKFIRYLKTFEKQYLQKSIIIVKDNYTLFLLKLIFLIQTPVTPVELVRTHSEAAAYYNITESIPIMQKKQN